MQSLRPGRCAFGAAQPRRWTDAAGCESASLLSGSLGPKNFLRTRRARICDGLGSRSLYTSNVSKNTKCKTNPSSQLLTFPIILFCFPFLSLSFSSQTPSHPSPRLSTQAPGLSCKGLPRPRHRRVEHGRAHGVQFVLMKCKGRECLGCLA